MDRRVARAEVRRIDRAPREAGPSTDPSVVVSGEQDLWLLAEAMTAAEAGDARSLALLFPVVARHRGEVLAEKAVPAVLAPHDVARLAILARIGRLTEDIELCGATCAALSRRSGEFVLLEAGSPLGPVGWFLAEALVLLGRSEEAMVANRRAQRASQAEGDHAWTTRCRLQRRGLAPPTDAESSDDAAAVAVGSLTSRQREILALAAHGMTNAQIAASLYISVATVERHCTIAYRALDVRNRAQALALLAGLRFRDAV